MRPGHPRAHVDLAIAIDHNDHLLVILVQRWSRPDSSTTNISCENSSLFLLSPRVQIRFDSKVEPYLARVAGRVEYVPRL